MRTSTLFGAKNIRFFEIYGVSARTRGRGFSQYRHFADKGEGESIFRDFVRTSFMDGPLTVLLRLTADYEVLSFPRMTSLIF